MEELDSAPGITQSGVGGGEKAHPTYTYRYFWSMLGDVDSPHQIWDSQSVSVQGKVYVIDLARSQGCTQEGVGS